MTDKQTEPVVNATTQGEVNKDNKNQTDENTKPFKTFATEDEYNNSIKSEVSKGKNSLLQEIGVKSVKEAKDYLDKANQYSELETKYSSLQDEHVLTKFGVKSEFKDEALLLAKTRVKDDVKLEDAMKDVLTKMPSLVDKNIFDANIGADRSKGKVETDSSSKHINKIAPWVKL